jgi:hypothetical protein
MACYATSTRVITNSIIPTSRSLRSDKISRSIFLRSLHQKLLKCGNKTLLPPAALWSSNLYLSQYNFSSDLIPLMTMLGHGFMPAIVILALHFPATSYLHHKKLTVTFVFESSWSHRGLSLIWVGGWLSSLPNYLKQKEIASAICFQKKRTKEFAGCMGRKLGKGSPSSGKTVALRLWGHELSHGNNLF